MSNKEYAERLTRLLNELERLPMNVDAGEDLEAREARLTGYAEALAMASETLESLPQGASMADIIEGHSMLQTTLFSVVQQLVLLQGLAGRNPPRTKLDSIAIRQMMKLYRSTDHEKIQARYNAALMGLAGGEDRP